MTNLITNYSSIPFQQIQIQDALNQIKADIENAIVTGGEKAKIALIRSQGPITLIHNALKTGFLDARVHPSLINPEPKRLMLNATNTNNQEQTPIELKDKELALAGYLKTKYQDISIIPNNIHVNAEVLQFPTYLHGFKDKFGASFTESVLSVNVRSQLSSVAKNFDTLYERTFAEALNFHLRCPKMVLGEVYMIIAKEYDSGAAAENRVAFKNSSHIEKYILAFQALNNRTTTNDDHYKYERVALLIVDFSQSVPKLYNTTEELISDGLIPEDSLADFTSLSLTTFVGDIMGIYQTRFPDNSFN